MAMPIVELSKSELNDCASAGEQRHRLARIEKKPASEKDEHTDMEKDCKHDLLGIAGEVAVAKVLGIQFNPFQFGVDTGIDLFFGDFSIDVKTTNYPIKTHPHLLMNTNKEPVCDVVVLVTKEAENKFGIAGCISKKEWGLKCQPHLRKDGRFFGSYCVKHTELKDIYELVAAKNKMDFDRRWLKNE